MKLEDVKDNTMLSGPGLHDKEAKCPHCGSVDIVQVGSNLVVEVMFCNDCEREFNI